jgi:integrase
MAREMERLTAQQVRRRGSGWHHDGGGLYLRVDADGGRYFFFRWGAGGAQYLSLGPTHTISLARAREKARACRELLIDGRDPKAERTTLRLTTRIEAAKRVSFADCADRYFEAHKAAWRSPRHLRDWRNSVRTHAEPVFGALPVGAIDVDLVLKVLEPIWRTKTATAARLRERIEAILDFAKVRGLRDGENPARWKGHLDHLLPSPGKIARTRHHAALPYDDVPAFMSRLRGVSGTTARALEFTILTAARAGEACGARWSEISGDTWTVPAERMKGGQEHRVPLSAGVLDMLARMEARTETSGRYLTGSAFVFPAGQDRPVHGNSVLLLAKELGAGTVHGFRSSFRDWVEEQTNFPSTAAELALAHRVKNAAEMALARQVGSATERSYRRGDAFETRSELMTAWGRYCVGEAVSGVVVSLAARRHG